MAGYATPTERAAWTVRLSALSFVDAVGALGRPADTVVASKTEAGAVVRFTDQTLGAVRRHVANLAPSAWCTRTAAVDVSFVSVLDLVRAVFTRAGAVRTR